MLTSICVTVSDKEPQWFTVVFSKVLWCKPYKPLLLFVNDPVPK
jgi:hypothetical protein